MQRVVGWLFYADGMPLSLLATLLLAAVFHAAFQRWP